MGKKIFRKLRGEKGGSSKSDLRVMRQVNVSLFQFWRIEGRFKEGDIVSGYISYNIVCNIS